jgi:hypothetical protein
MIKFKLNLTAKPKLNLMDKPKIYIEWLNLTNQI